MLVRELIKHLSKLNPEAKVIAATENTDYCGEAQIQIGFVPKSDEFTPFLSDTPDGHTTSDGEILEMVEGILIWG